MSIKFNEFRDKPVSLECSCSVLFQGFNWRLLYELKCGDLPRSPGVYVLWLVNPGNIDIAVEFLEDIIMRINWLEMKKFLWSRAKRLKRLKTMKCPVIYIGSTRNLASRCKELAGRRHTVFTAILALLVSSSIIDYGFKVTGSIGEARILEDELKTKYSRIHRFKPALVER